MVALPRSVIAHFVEAGWTPTRRVPVPVAVPSDHPAFDVLAELGGLTVGKCGAGKECATSDLAFEWSDFADDTVTWWGQRLRTHLIKVAEYHHAHGELYVDSAERCFSASLV